MPAIVVVAVVLSAFALGYRYYSSYVADKVYALDPAFVTPAHEFEDGVDYVPTNRHVLFGHHFTSVAGAAPIVGPAIAVFWGWGPALAWITVGTIFAAGVHDFGALVVSVRNKGRNIGTLTAEVINRRARALFLVVIFFLLTLVNAVFAVVISILFVNNPAAVIPIFVEIPLAIAVGQLIYRRQIGILVPSIVAVVVMYLFIPVGQLYPVDLAPLSEATGVPVRALWVVILFVYAFIACRLPVWVLLQPRDFINAHQLFIALFVIFGGLALGGFVIEAPFYNANLPADAPFWFPFLFITIACGAVSGFHSLVASGTTAKQLDKEPDARFVGVMGTVGEGSLALGSVMAVSAGIGGAAVYAERYADFGAASAGGLGYFTEGVGRFVTSFGIPAEIGAIFAAVVVVSFAATTLDTGVRLQRYVIQEMAETAGFRPLARNIWAATVLAVLVPLALALVPGEGDAGFTFGRLWRLFGTTNQLMAGLALAVVATWVVKRRRNPAAPLVPLIFLLTMTTWALFIQLGEFWAERDYLLVVLDAVIFFLALWLIVEAAMAINQAFKDRHGAPAAESDVEATGRP
ncbi:MAG TPA: carbon starvation protein A [Egibacteraceae bacterium]|jgi:carbon starvation protein|nr:carbon starvation protein A [Egibacteraceae bacterium]